MDEVFGQQTSIQDKEVAERVWRNVSQAEATKLSSAQVA